MIYHVIVIFIVVVVVVIEETIHTMYNIINTILN